MLPWIIAGAPAVTRLFARETCARRPGIDGEAAGMPDAAEAASAKSSVVLDMAQVDEDDRTVEPPVIKCFPCGKASLADVSQISGAR